jgi:hypothetical protein
MRSRERSSRENRRFSCLEKVPEDFFHGQIGEDKFACEQAAGVGTGGGRVWKRPTAVKSGLPVGNPRAGGVDSMQPGDRGFSRDPCAL